MKTFVLFLAVVFAATTLIGCGKKKKDESASMEGLNGVVSENVVSVTEPAAGVAQSPAEAVPVVVDNAQNATQPAPGEMAAVV